MLDWGTGVIGAAVGVELEGCCVESCEEMLVVGVDLVLDSGEDGGFVLGCCFWELLVL